MSVQNMTKMSIITKLLTTLQSYESTWLFCFAWVRIRTSQTWQLKHRLHSVTLYRTFSEDMPGVSAHAYPSRTLSVFPPLHTVHAFATNFRNLTLIKNTILNPSCLLQTKQPERGFFVHHESFPSDASLSHVSGNSTPTEHTNNPWMLQVGTGLEQEMPPHNSTALAWPQRHHRQWPCGTEADHDCTSGAVHTHQ